MDPFDFNLSDFQDVLSYREYTVLKEVSEGYSYREIGAKYNLSARRIATLARKAMKKVGKHEKND